MRFLNAVLMLVLLSTTGCASLGFTSYEETAGESDLTNAGAAEAPAKNGSEDGAEGASEESEMLEGAAVASEEITFESHGEKFVGELVYPDIEGDQPRPGVVIAHDAGPLGRDGIVRGAFGVELPVEVAVYRSMAEALASRGFVVMIFDKRTCLEGSMPWCSYPRTQIEGHVDTLGEVLVDDVVAAAKALSASPRTNAQIHLIGHGQGAQVVLAAAAAVDPASVVLASPDSAPLDAMILSQSQRSIEAMRARAAEKSNAETDAMVEQAKALETQAAELETAFAAIRAGEGEETAGLSAQAWRSFIALSESAEEADVSRVLVVDAGMDLDVEDEARTAYALGWSEAGAEVVTFDELTRPLVSVSPEEDPTVVSSQVMARIALFLSAGD